MQNVAISRCCFVTSCKQRQRNEQRILYNNQINARALIGQSAMEYRGSSELLYKSNRSQVSMVYGLINHMGCW